MKKRKKNLIVFITPKIIKTARDKADIIKDQVDQRLEFIKTFMNNKDSNAGQIQKILSQSSPSKPQEETAELPASDFQPEQEILIEEPVEIDSIEDDKESPQEEIPNQTKMEEPAEEANIKENLFVPEFSEDMNTEETMKE